MSLLGTIYGGSWNEKSRTNIKAELQQELNAANATVSNALITVNPMQKKMEDGSKKDILDSNGNKIYTNSITLTLVSKTEKDSAGNPVVLGDSYLRLSKKSSLQPGDHVNVDSIERIVLSKTGELDKEYYDAEKLETGKLFTITL